MDGRAAAKEAGVDQGYIALAFLVLEYAKEFIPDIESGEKTLSDCYELAAQRKKQAQLDKPVKANLTNLRPGKILSYPTGTLRIAEARHTRS